MVQQEEMIQGRISGRWPGGWWQEWALTSRQYCVHGVERR